MDLLQNTLLSPPYPSLLFDIPLPLFQFYLPLLPSLPIYHLKPFIPTIGERPDRSGSFKSKTIPLLEGIFLQNLTKLRTKFLIIQPS